LNGFYAWFLEPGSKYVLVAAPVAQPQNIDRPRVKGAFHRPVGQFEGRVGLKL
jgi:hypothetical protein